MQSDQETLTVGERALLTPQQRAMAAAEIVATIALRIIKDRHEQEGDTLSTEF